MGHWSPDQLAAFPEATENHSLASAFHLSASGLRRGEVVALRWEDVDLDAGELTITRNAVTIRGQVKEGSPKSLAGNRTVILGDDTLAALKRARRARIGSDHVCTDEAGRPLHPDRYSDAFQRAARAAGLPVIPLHGVRHTVITKLRARGVPVADVMAQVGHSSPAMTDR